MNHGDETGFGKAGGEAYGGLFQYAYVIDAVRVSRKGISKSEHPYVTKKQYRAFVPVKYIFYCFYKLFSHVFAVDSSATLLLLPHILLSSGFCGATPGYSSSSYSHTL